MGNSQTKKLDTDSPTMVTSEPSKESQLHPTSFDVDVNNENNPAEDSNNDHIEEKKEKDFENAITPRTKQKSKGGFLDRQPSGAGGGNAVQARDDEGMSSSHITDDQVQVNLAMADLMAYLQVVANNSNHLPLTRRDDPELDRTMTTLTSEDYARKSAAFIPADVRVIGGTFTRYGRVWDLPTSEEYNACDGAHEPGRSYGGACCNAFLKVLYDAANDATDAAHNAAASAALFDDDDDDEEESMGTSVLAGKSHKSGFSLEYAIPNQSSISWADLLRKMKAEMKDIEYAQVPKITTTRKIDLSKPFSLVPDNFDPTKGKKRSLLIGCNYKNISGAELKASHDDVRSMKDYIVNVHGFPEVKGLMTVLLDDDDHKHPTFLNITEAFKALSEESQPGDAVFVQFSGHGGRVLDAPIDTEAESYDEVIVPSDYVASGLIRDTLIFKTLLAPMRYGVTVTIMVDCCDTGMVMELPYSWSTKSERKDAVAKLTTNDDFSFVRFLKVVKTLYESSTFTQLGRTVGCALNPNAALDYGHRANQNADDNSQLYDDADMEVSIGQKTSIFDAFADACTGGTRSPSRRMKSKDDGTKNSAEKSKDLLTKRDGTAAQSLLEQVMNCTLMTNADDEFSDEDTFQSRTEDEGSYDDTERDSFKSLASAEDDRKRRQHQKSKRKQRR